MKCTLLQENLIKRIQEASRFVSNKPQIPILSGMHLATNDGAVTIQTTDLRVGYQSTIGGKIEDEGSCVLPLKPFLEFISTLHAGPVTIELVGDSVKVIQKGIHAKFPTFPVSEFPPFPVFDGSSTKLKRESFAQTLSSVLYAASLDETRPILASVLVKMEDGQLTCVCTDGYRLSVATNKVPSDHAFTGTVLLPAKAVVELLSILTHSTSETISFGVSSELSSVLVSVGESTLLIRLVEGNFPPYEKIIPTSFELTTIIDRSEWVDALKTALVFARETASIVNLEFSDGTCTLKSASAGVGEHESSIASSAKLTDPKTIAFNGKFLLDVLTHLDGNAVKFAMTDAAKPGVFQVEGQDYPLAVVMPFKR